MQSMSLFELRQWWESLLPWWAPFIVPVIAIVGLCVCFIQSFLQGLYDSYKAKERFRRKKEQNSQRGLDQQARLRYNKVPVAKSRLTSMSMKKGLLAFSPVDFGALMLWETGSAVTRMSYEQGVRFLMLQLFEIKLGGVEKSYFEILQFHQMAFFAFSPNFLFFRNMYMLITFFLIHQFFIPGLVIAGIGVTILMTKRYG